MSKTNLQDTPTPASYTALPLDKALNYERDGELLFAVAPKPRKIVAVGFIVNHGATVLVVAPEVK